MISEKGYRFVNSKGGIPYADLPFTLSVYDVGVILYKGHIPNYIYNAPNKLFEYWSCGLDVWFPDKMIGSLQYSRAECFPKLMPVNFDEIDKLDLNSALSRAGIGYQSSPYYCEKVFESFFLNTLADRN